MGDITMRIEDTRRIAVLDKLMNKTMKQSTAAEVLGITVRQVRRLLKRYKQDGAKGIIHKLRGLPGNHQAKASELDSALNIIRTKYHDFSLVHAHEKLVLCHKFPYSRETLRQALINVGELTPKRKHKLVIHSIRERRAREGELVQIDGSPHDWLEGRGEYCTLIVFIDDATGRLKYLRLVPHETTLAYMAGLKSYIQENGKPLALYSDRHSIFRINTRKNGASSVADESGLTQFGRATRELSIELIFANSPQAKGRVERVNKTLQGRLPKELRLLGINTQEEANRYLPTYMEEFNKQFGVAATNSVAANTPICDNEKLEEILVEKNSRLVSKTLTISYENQLLQIIPPKGTDGRALVRLLIEVREDTEGKITILTSGRRLEYKVVATTHAPHIIDSKRLNEAVNKLTPQILPPDYEEPWLLFNPRPQPLFTT